MSRDPAAQPATSTARARLAALSEKKAPNKAARIRALWPEIKAALDNGHSHESVCECLAADGINVSARSLASYVSRIRRAATAGRGRTVSLKANSKTSPRQKERPSTISSIESQPKTIEGPLANVRERQRKRSGFDYRPELADLKELI